MNAKSIIWIILMRVILHVSATHNYFHNARRSSKVPSLLKRLVENYPMIRKSARLLPEYEDVPPTPISDFENYEWSYEDIGLILPSSYRGRRQAGFRPGSRRAICARTRSGRCVAKCGFGAPLDTISNNILFGCSPVRRQKYQRI